MRVTWVQPEDVVRHELWQSEQEGKDVAAVRRAWREAGGEDGFPYGGATADPAPPTLRARALELLDDLAALTGPADADEPSDWPGIIAQLGTVPATGATADPERITSAWLGRGIGCVLGKPVEKIPRAGIEEILRATDRWPLDRWFTAVGLPEEVSQRWPWNRASRPTSLEENIDGMPEDDDTNYTLMALRLIEQHGRDFTADDVAQMWLLDLPAGRVFTAERAAYRNLLMGMSPPETAFHHNPFREWIGAQIRTDLYGWVNPGDPLAAAEMAFRDASVSHTRNGIYGAMFVAAMASLAVTGASVEQVLDAGEAVVPPRSRLRAAIRFGRELAERGVGYAEAYPELERAYGHVHWVHSLNNSALVAYALTSSDGDFSTAICRTVMGGWDTDSNGATVGAVMGAVVGPEGIERRWSEPLHDRLSTSIPGCDGSSFGDLARRTIALLP
ncbi:hypothetical protein CGZ93_10555 [Enemella dayhoffiae]|uniref:ADP-ribosylglycohydrolase n=1 Tax=Enemella dayhoffiae TaxID=2016507 RepID=A0A255H130_9ACTN|nr:ADP-ribosylglycohydrolase family protein [Enemella dayhoffiae]OYO21377.1 hypothetical protein CGZ93_10555 [Enemella dayhoffiae]